MNYIPPRFSLIQNADNSFLQQQIKQREINQYTYIFENYNIGRLNEVKESLRYKEKSKIYIIFINGESLGSPYNTNQFLLKKHESLDNNNRKEVQPPGSLLAYLLNEKQVDHQSPITNNFDSIKETQELPQVPLNQYQI